MGGSYARACVCSVGVVSGSDHPDIVWVINRPIIPIRLRRYWFYNTHKDQWFDDDGWWRDGRACPGWTAEDQWQVYE